MREDGMSVHIDKIRIDGGTQSRAAINEATVAEYAEAMEDPNTAFPPAIVYFDGKEYWLADGFHRLEAWRRIGRTDIPTDVRQGDRRRAILHSVAANSAHGLRRTNEDKRRAVMTLLEDPEWSQWSDREIARRCSVSHPFVATVRASVTGSVTSDDRQYTTRHGTTATMDTGNIGKAAPQPSLAECQPDAAAAPAKTDDCQPAAADPQSAPEPDPLAPYRKGLSGLTREGLEDEAAGLRANLADAKTELRALRDENRRLKEQVKNFEGDQAEVIRRQDRLIKHKDSEVFRANESLALEKRRTYAMGKEIEQLKRSLEMQEIVL